MKIERCPNPACYRPFGITEIGGRMPVSKRIEDLLCPHCKHNNPRMSYGVYHTVRLLPEEEQDWLQKNVKN